MAEGTVIAENTVGELMQDSVSRTLAIEMLDGVWKAGESLTLEALQSRFGISRTVAREVAKTLESMNAVLVKRRIGLVARPFGEWQALNHQVIEWRLHSTQRERQLSSLTELRLAVEPAAAASAARLAPLDVKAKFPVYAARMRQIAEANEEGEAGLAQFHDLDVEFHTLILHESGNELFAALSDTIATVLRGRVELGKYRSPRGSLNVRAAPCSTSSTKWHVPSISSDFRAKLAFFSEKSQLRLLCGRLLPCATFQT